MNIDIAPFLAAVIDLEGGTYRIPYAVLQAQTGEKALALDFEDDGATLVLRLIDAKDVPEEDDSVGTADA
jgi:hypothetical protein